MKSILFIIPWMRSVVGCKDFHFAESPERAPENVVSLASYLRHNGSSVRIADMTRLVVQANGDLEMALALLWEECVSFKPDVIGFSFFTARFEAAVRTLEFLREKYGETRPLMIAGGVHPTLLPELTLEHMQLDALIIGEGELPLLSLLRGDALHEIAGVYTKGMKGFSQAECLADLDEIPFSDWTLIDKDFYAQPSYQISNTRLDAVMPITFGRGCMYRCNFCAHNSFLKARCHSPEYFVEMMRYTAKVCNVDTFIVQDSSIGNFKREWKKVCELLISSGERFRWWANLRANQVDEDFLVLLKHAGCIKLFFGFESGSPGLLEQMNKKETVEHFVSAAELCHKVGIPFYTSYIINYPGEGEADMEMTEQLILQTKPTSLSINEFSPIPGSFDYERLKESLLPYLNDVHDWSDLGMLLSPVRYSGLTEDRYAYWKRRLKSLKNEINSNEGI